MSRSPSSSSARSSRAACALFTLAALALPAAGPRAQSLVLDINRSTPTGAPNSNPFPDSLGTLAVCTADDGQHGTELWRTDGTAAGTALVADIRPGSGTSVSWTLGTGTGAQLANGLFLFVAHDGVHGRELWRTDGTTAGTALVADIAPGPAGSFLLPLANDPIAAGATVYFTADDSVHGRELWRSDGTPAGTMMVLDLNPGAATSSPALLAVSNGVLYFATAMPSAFARQLWRTDGTAAGTVLLHDFGDLGPFYGIGPMVELSGALYFPAYDAVHGEELWRTDGTAAGTALLADVRAGVGSSMLVSYALARAGSLLFFRANDGSTGDELWRTDGTAAGTVMVKDVFPGTGSSAPKYLTALGNLLLFAAIDATTGDEPWSSDGTAAGTRRLADISSGPSPGPFTVLGNLALFPATSFTQGAELWRTDGTPSGTALVRDIRAGKDGSAPSALVAHGGMVLFAADDGVHGVELWRSDGTAVGTRLVADIATPPGTSPQIAWPTEIGDRLAFLADDGVLGLEPWISDGSAAGTHVLADLYPGATSSQPQFLWNLNETLLTVAFVPGRGWSLLRSDGTAAGTQEVLLLQGAAAPTASLFRPLAALDGILYMSADDGIAGNELWRTDGTAAGTRLVADIVPGSGSSSPHHGVAANSTLFFLVSKLNGMQLWKSDGTAAGTVLVKDVSTLVMPFNSAIATAGGTVYYLANDGASGIELWKSDGTTAGTLMLLDIYPGSGSSYPSYLCPLGDVLLFAADDGVHGIELWRTDGTAAGTTMVLDIEPGSSAGRPTDLCAAGGVVFFAASDAAGGRELWRSDGTAAGTWRVADIEPGVASSSPAAIAAAGSGRNILFQARDRDHGLEVWTSDGTPAGTVRLSDIEPGALDASPHLFTRAGTTVFFLAQQWAIGDELFAMQLARTGASLAAPFGRRCKGPGGSEPAIAASGLPVLGNAAFAIGMTQARPLVPAALHLSLGTTTFALPPCLGYLAPPFVTVRATTDAGGNAWVTAPVPNDPVFLALALYAQWSVVDDPGLGSVTLTDALRCLVGR